MVTSLNCIMFNILPVRKLIKVVSKKRGLSKRDRAPTSLNVIDKNVPVRSHSQIYFFIFILLLLYIIHSARLYYNIYNKYGNFPTFVSSEEANIYSPIRGPAKTLPVCFFDIRKFGNISVNKSVTDISDTDYSSVQRGGYYTPEECRSPNKVALIVPYRNREENLATFLLNIHPFLMKQKLEYRIFIIEQKGTELFNRGKLINAGFKEMMKYGSWGCVVFHDVDLLPTDERILYSCPIWPRHMCAKIIEITEKSFYTFFGGVSAMTTAHFQKINGFSNLYWGWGGEDTDIFWRIRAQDIPIERYNRNIAKFTSLNHSKQVENTLRYSLLNTAIDRYKHDGLSTLKYTVEFVTLHRLYTHILIDINPNNENITEIMIKQSGTY